MKWMWILIAALFLMPGNEAYARRHHGNRRRGRTFHQKLTRTDAEKSLSRAFDYFRNRNRHTRSSRELDQLNREIEQKSRSIREMEEVRRKEEEVRRLDSKLRQMRTGR